MIRRSVLTSAYLLDWVAGDPEWFPHPVRLIGAAVARGERFLRASDHSEIGDFIAGGALTFGLVAISYICTRKLLSVTYRHSRSTGSLTEVLLAWTCLASRGLHDEASAVMRALNSNDPAQARLRIARIVGRDTHLLDEQGISRALIETLAESSCDGVVAPLFYLLCGGVPLAMAFKTVSTLDSMIGHSSERYLYFGKVAARLDDAANFLPARLSALALCAAAMLFPSSSSLSAASIWLRDGSRHKSPNAGQPEAAMAGALKVCLGGPSTYAGELVDASTLGREFPPPSRCHAARAIHLTMAVSCVAFFAAFLVARPKRSSTLETAV
jgi:adenosylcobinamide-phosphate synthase